MNAQTAVKLAAEGLTVTQIGDRLGCSASWVSRMIARAGGETAIIKRRRNPSAWHPFSPGMVAVKEALVAARKTPGLYLSTAELAEIADITSADLSTRLGGLKERGAIVNELRRREGGGPGVPYQAFWRLKG